jgi:hypothetical protein
VAADWKRLFVQYYTAAITLIISSRLVANAKAGLLCLQYF